MGFLRPPLVANAPQEVLDSEADLRQALAPLVGEEVFKTRAAPWHARGFRGAGVKVGIVDFFDGAMWAASQGTGEVPAPAGRFCQFDGAACSVDDFGSNHGIGVAEIIHEMAPGAQLYLATARTAADLQAVVNYFAA